MFRALSDSREQNGSKDGLVRVLRGIAITLVFAFAIAVPIIISIDNGQDKPRSGPDGITLTASEATGRGLFARTCATCHTLATANAVGRVGPDLDVLIPTLPPASREAFVLGAIQSGFAIGKGQMPAGLYAGRDATDIAQFVAAVAGK
jgi:mono/diheme cytochrome c family protein